MNAALVKPAEQLGLKISLDWAKLPLFERKGWKRVRFGDVVRVLKEHIDPALGEVDRHVAGEHMETENVHIRNWELDSRPGYKAEGCQIDGAVTIEGTTFLVETKFVTDPLGSPDVDIFMAKIESKADNTMGLLVALSGFNEGAKRAASKQRTPMLLIDHGHIFSLMLNGVHDHATSCFEN